MYVHLAEGSIGLHDVEQCLSAIIIDFSADIVQYLVSLCSCYIIGYRVFKLIIHIINIGILFIRNEYLSVVYELFMALYFTYLFC